MRNKGKMVSSIGFLESTKIIDRVVFNISEALLTLLGLVPVLGGLFSTIPVSIGSDVVFMGNLQLSGNALRNIQSIQYNLKNCPPNFLGYL
ncbi:solute carrier family 23 protein [Peribacillus frigoritolerans]|uniref:solute carrier family 23 protein n=1 Tax=Peribacillus frigoritolerans TaxID=450367 RepID=UPI00330574EB